MLEPYQKKIIELYLKQELQLARLYNIFAAKFPTHADFWTSLTKEELKHAEWLKKLYLAEKKELVAFSEGKVKTYTLKAIDEHIEKIIQRAENDAIDLKSAMAYTLDFERSLIEKEVFSHFKAIDQKVHGVMSKLEEQTKDHIGRAEEMMRLIR